MMDAIQCGNVPLQAAIAQIKSRSNDPNGIRNTFEEATAYLLHFCPVSKKRKTQSGDRNYNISSVGIESNKKTAKPNKGKMGVDLRYYKPKEYCKLSTEQMEEFCKWRKDKGFTKTTNKEKVSMKDQIVATIKEVSREK